MNKTRISTSSSTLAKTRSPPPIFKQPMKSTFHGVHIYLILHRINIAKDLGVTMYQRMRFESDHRASWQKVNSFPSFLLPSTPRSPGILSFPSHSPRRIGVGRGGSRSVSIANPISK